MDSTKYKTVNCPKERTPAAWYVTCYDSRLTVEQKWFPLVWGLANLLGVVAHGAGIVYTPRRRA